MKILVIGGTKGNVDIINEHLTKSGADIALCTGDLGIFYRKENFEILPKSFETNLFYQYLEGKKEFIKPVYSVRGAHDNLSLCKKLHEGYFHINNFHLLGDGETVSIIHVDKTITIGGIGGSYSPKYYDCDTLKGNEKRHFTKNHVNNLKQHKLTLLILHDLIGPCTKKKLNYSQEIFDLLDSTRPLYCFVGKYHWWGYSKLPNVNLVIIPYAKDGYLLIDTEDWNASGVRFDMSIGEK